MNEPVRGLHTSASSQLPAALRQQIRDMLNDAFDGDFSDDDWNHSLGGTHVWVSAADAVTTHASVVERTLICDGVSLQVGYVEAVATTASRRRGGQGTAVMKRINELIQQRYVLGALSTEVHRFYAGLGWERWLGPTLVDTPDGRLRTPDDDGDIMILRTPRTPRLELGGEIVADWRAGDVW